MSQMDVQTGRQTDWRTTCHGNTTYHGNKGINTNAEVCSLHNATNVIIYTRNSICLLVAQKFNVMHPIKGNWITNPGKPQFKNLH